METFLLSYVILHHLKKTPNNLTDLNDNDAFVCVLHGKRIMTLKALTSRILMVELLVWQATVLDKTSSFHSKQEG